MAPKFSLRDQLSLRQARRLVILVFGVSVLLVGIAMVVLPGPAFIVIPAGLSILAIEFAWARRWLQRFKDAVSGARRRFGSDNGKPNDQGPAQ